MKEELQTISTIQPFSITFHSISIGPDRSHPRLVWATGNSSQALENLKENLEKALTKKSEKRTFIPHVTITRFTKKTNKNISLNESIQWNEIISEVTLVEAHLSPTGATYTPLFTNT